ncbi:MAG: hydrogenase maturation nickel metallochaperone HypA [Ruminococcus sp.]|nr:hydrogenase maturation nickel metallochaperone HypA [Ruminococcus sp.]
MEEKVLNEEQAEQVDGGKIGIFDRYKCNNCGKDFGTSRYSKCPDCGSTDIKGYMLYR